MRTVWEQCGKPDVLALNETKLSVNKEGTQAKEEIGNSLEGFESFWTVCSTRGGYAGVAVFCREGLVTNAREWFEESDGACSCEQCAVLRLEGRVLCLDLGPSLSLICVCTCMLFWLLVHWQYSQCTLLIRRSQWRQRERGFQ